ncbi:MAG: DUF4129 domain-containing protein [Bacteroides sp.]|nr:DUF4129 domain-containing protein [Bacteroides sp.]
MSKLNDTLTADQDRLFYWQSDPAFDYNAEFAASAPDDRSNVLVDWLLDVISAFLRLIFGRQVSISTTHIVLVVCLVLFVVLLIWYLYKKRDRWIGFFRAYSVPYEVTPDTIYGIDFEADIRQAASQGNYKEAVRLVYLQTLRNLSDRELIFWELYKTPTEYMYELKDEGLRTPFRELTNRFLEVRYGNFQATRSTYDQVLALRSCMVAEGGLP